MDWFLSVITMIYLYLMGKKTIWGPVLGVFAQLFWIYFSITSKNYGLIVCSIGIMVIQINNVRLWGNKCSQEDE